MGYVIYDKQLERIKEQELPTTWTNTQNQVFGNE